MYNSENQNGRSVPFTSLFLAAFFLLAAPLVSFGQGTDKSKDKDPNAVCKLKVNGKDYELKANAGGYYQRIANVKPSDVVPVELYYPSGSEGEAVSLAVLDGGRINGSKIAEVVKLDAAQKCAFNFHLTSNSGLFRVLVTKGSDEKVVQVWVGPEAQPVKR